MTETDGFPPEEPAPAPEPVEEPAPAPVRPPEPAWLIDARQNAPGWLLAALEGLHARLGDLEHGG